MVDEGDVAVLAPLGEAAVKAEYLSREAASVEEQNRLVAFDKCLFERALQRSRKNGLTSSDTALSLFLQVDDLYARKRSACNAMREDETRQLAAIGGQTGFEGGCCGAENQRAVRTLRSESCEIARVVAEAFVILVRRVVFFVDDQDTQVVDGREQRTSGADSNRYLAPCKTPPLLEAFTRLESAVEHGESIPEAPRSRATIWCVRVISGTSTSA